MPHVASRSLTGNRRRLRPHAVCMEGGTRRISGGYSGLIDFRKTLKMTPAEIRESLCPLSWKAQMQKVIDAIKTKDK